MLSKRGAAMLAAILFLMVASGIITLIFTSTLSEIRQSGDDVAIVQTLTLARGGANLGGRLLNEGIRSDLSALTLEHADTVNKWPFGDNSDITQPDPTPASVISDMSAVTSDLQTKIDARLCSTQLSASAAQKVSLKVFVTKQACGGNLPSGVKLPAARYVSGSVRTYSVPYVLVSEATVGEYSRSIVSQGEYQFTVGGGKFSQFALFTNEHVTPTGGDIWFTDHTLFDGPVHTNSTFRFHGDPWFGGAVTSAGCTGADSSGCTSYNRGADFHSQGFVSASNLGSNPVYGTDAPQLTGGVDWNASYLDLPDNALDQRSAASDNGLLLSEDLYSLTVFAGDADENSLTSDGSGGWTPAASYQYIEKCTTATDCEVYRYGSDNKLYKKNTVLDALGVVTLVNWTLEESDFNGVVYVEGKVERFSGPPRSPASSSDPAAAPPALASFAQMTVVPEDGLRITGDLTYEDPPCSGTPQMVSGSVQKPSCDDLNVKNVLGIFAPDNDILIGNQHSDSSLNAPDNVAIHGSLMAGAGVVRVENHNSGAVRGSVNLLGGLIEDRYGAFGTFNTDTGSQLSGYGRKFTFDQRMGLGFSPPYFPGTAPSTVQSVFVYSFGQREQAY